MWGPVSVPRSSDLTVVLLGGDEVPGNAPYLRGRTVAWQTQLLVNLGAELSGSGTLVFSTGLAEEDARAWCDGQRGVSVASVEAAVRELASGAMGLKNEDVGVRLAYPGNVQAVAGAKPASRLSHGTAKRRVSAEVSVELSGPVQSKLRKVRARSAAPLFPEKTEAQLRREVRARMDSQGAAIVELKESHTKLQESHTKLEESHTKLQESHTKLKEMVANHEARIKVLEAALRGVMDPLTTRMIIEALQRVVVMEFYNTSDDELPCDAVRNMKNKPPKPDGGDLPPVLASKWIPFVTDLERRLKRGDAAATFRAFAEVTLGVPGYVLDVVAGQAASRLYTTVSAPFHKGSLDRALAHADGNPSVPPEGRDAWEACRVRLMAAIDGHRVRLPGRPAGRPPRADGSVHKHYTWGILAHLPVYGRPIICDDHYM